jgi:LTXXQ motif family protein
MKRKAILLSACLAIAVAGSAGSLLAQQRGGGGPGWGMGHGWGMGPGMMGRDWMPGPGGRMGMGMGMGCPMMGFGDDGDTATFADGRIAFLKAELKITDAQKEVWGGYAEALKNNLATMTAMHQTMLTSFDAKTPVERLDARVSAMETRLGALKEMKPPLEKLYTALGDDQRKRADDLLTEMGCMM